VRSERPRARWCILPQINLNEETMGSTPSGSAAPTAGAALPQQLENDHAGGSRASVGGCI
jgi:hypothetical protein